MARANVVTQPELKWDDFADRPTSEALPKIYAHVDAFSTSLRGWYWEAIRGRRLGSTTARGASFFLAAAGVIGPLAAALPWTTDVSYRLWCTQAGVIALTLAGLARLCDQVFGWSSGWLRYITTVTALERLTRQFHLDWAGMLVGSTPGTLDALKKPLFDLAARFEADLLKRQSEETDGWVSEFNTSMAALQTMIESQKQATEQAAIEARDAVKQQAQISQTGAIEISFLLTQPGAISLTWDNEESTFHGTTWARGDVQPGLHRLSVKRDQSGEVQKMVEVKPGALTQLQVDLKPLGL